MTCKHFFKAVALALSLAVGAAPPSPRTANSRPRHRRRRRVVRRHGRIGQSHFHHVSELDVSLFPGGGLANVLPCTSRRARATSASPRTASSSRRPRASIPTEATENVMGLLNLHDSTRMHFIVNKASGITSPRPDQGRRCPSASPCPTPPGILSVRQVDRGNTASASRTSPHGANPPSTNDAASMMKDGQLDVALWIGPGEAFIVGHDEQRGPRYPARGRERHQGHW